MIIDAVLLSLAKTIAQERHGTENVAILPVMELPTTEDAVQLVNQDTGYELTLTGCIDYMVFRYKVSCGNTSKPSISSNHKRSGQVSRPGRDC